MDYLTEIPSNKHVFGFSCVVNPYVVLIRLGRMPENRSPSLHEVCELSSIKYTLCRIGHCPVLLSLFGSLSLSLQLYPKLSRNHPRKKTIAARTDLVMTQTIVWKQNAKVIDLNKARLFDTILLYCLYRRPYAQLHWWQQLQQ